MSQLENGPKGKNEIFASIKNEKSFFTVEFEDNVGAGLAALRRSVRLASREAAKAIGYIDLVLIDWSMLEGISDSSKDDEMGDEDMGNLGILAKIQFDRSLSAEEIRGFENALREEMMTRDFYLVEDVSEAVFEQDEIVSEPEIGSTEEF